MSKPRGELLETVLRWTPAQVVMQHRRRGLLAVLTYHAIHDGATFEAHLDVLEEIGRFVSLEDVAASATEGKPLPARPILVTFDDGDPSVLHTAGPLMHARGIPSAAFLVTDLIGTDAALWTAEVEQLVASGGRTALDPTADGRALVRTLKQQRDPARRQAIEELRATATGERPRARQLGSAEITSLVQMGVAIGSHTMSHPCLPQCSEDVMHRELAGSRELLADLLGEPPIALAYPNGNHDSRSRLAVSRAGYTLAFGFDHRLSPIPPNDPYLISRLRVNEHASANRVRTVVSGLHPALHHLRRRS